MKNKYDVIIIGSGPAGLSAAIYSARYKLDTLVISKELGGYVSVSHKICNYPSYIEITGAELANKMIEQVKRLNVPILNEEVISIGKDKDFIVKTSNEKFFCKKIIFAGGTVKNKLNVSGEKEFLGKGVSYCATCDAGFFKNKIVCVAGGSDAALTAALLLKEYASKVYIIYRGKDFVKAEPHWTHLVKKEEKIKTIFNEEIVEIIGEKSVEKVKLKSGKTLETNGIFIEIGSVPEINFISSLNIKEDKKGYIITDKFQKTNIPGFFAAGDITDNPLKQIVTAASQGAVAAHSAYREMKEE